MNFDNIGGDDGRPRIQLTQDDLISIKCSECGGEHFIQTLTMFAIPKLMIGTDVNKIQPVPSNFACADCGTQLDLEEWSTKSLTDSKIIDFNKNKG
jgi:hypothetical protein